VASAWTLCPPPPPSSSLDCSLWVLHAVLPQVTCSPDAQDSQVSAAVTQCTSSCAVQPDFNGAFGLMGPPLWWCQHCHDPATLLLLAVRDCVWAQAATAPASARHWRPREYRGPCPFTASRSLRMCADVDVRALAGSCGYCTLQDPCRAAHSDCFCKKMVRFGTSPAHPSPGWLLAHDVCIAA
jgi:hypothetical protein